MQSVVFGWLIYAYTKDPMSLGLIGLAEAIPAVGIALFGGHLADRFNRKKLILILLFFMLVITLLLSAFTYNENDSFARMGTFPLYFLIFLTGVARGLLSPSIAAFSAQLIPRQQFGNASAWSSTVWQLGAVTGPALGGFIYGFTNAFTASCSIGIFIGLTLVCYLFIKSRPLPEIHKSENLFESLVSGIRFVKNNNIMLSAISLDLFAVLFGGAVALLPMFADQVLHTGAEGLGLLRAAPALGAVVMALYLAYRPPMVNAGRTLLWAVGGFGMCMILFALSRNFILSMTLLALSGMLDAVSVVIRSTIMQALTPDNMRGRVSAVNTIFIGSSNEIGAFESGLTARLMGLVPAVIFGGTMTLIVVLVGWKKSPALRTLNLNRILNESGDNGTGS